MSPNSTCRICLEICVDSLESALNAAEGGADRLELCTALSEGGLTPTTALLKFLKQRVQIPIFCMVRPRNGPMIYSENEKEQMLLEARALKEAGANGLVFGALAPDGTVNQQFCRKVMKVVDDLPCTFHRAFDQTVDPLKELEVLIDTGFRRVLTSGAKSSAMEGASLIKDLVEVAKGRIVILAGAGVRSNNCAELVRSTGVKEIHSSAKVKNKDNPVHFQYLREGRCSRRLFPQYGIHEARMGDQEDEGYTFVACTQEIRLIKSELQKL